MQVRVDIVAVLALCAAVQVGSIRQKVTPVEKVITLLEKLKAETAAEGKQEAEDYDKFACFCKEQADDKLYAITKSKEKITMQDANIKLLTGEIDELTASIADLKAKKADLNKEQKSAAEARAKEFEAYSIEEADLAGAISAMKRAIAALEDSKKKMKNSKLSLLQGVSRPALQKIAASKARLTGEQLQALNALLDMTGPAGHASTYQSNDIIATLKGMLKEFKGNKNELDTEESEKRNEHEMQAQARGNTMKFIQEDIEEQAQQAAKKEEEKSQTEKEMEEETADMEADQAFMKDLTEKCEQKAKDFDQRSKARSGELTALTQAIEIMKSGVQPNYGANKKLNLVASKSSQTHGHWAWVQEGSSPVSAAGSRGQGSPSAPSFLQLGGAASRSARLLEFLSHKASFLQSPALSALAIKLRFQTAVGKDHFVKIRGMINDLIKKLKADAEAEASQKAFCDEEMGKATESRDDAIGSVETQTANIDSAESKIAKLTEDITELENQVADLRKGLFEATELRAKEKAQNEKTIAESDAGLQAVQNALEVLKNFYENAFVQFVPENAGRDGKTVDDLAPDAASGEYKGNQDAAKGIFGLMEVIESDFERTLETTKADEEEAQNAFEEYEKETNDDIDEKTKTKKEKEEEKEQTEADLVGYKEELADAKEKLELAKKELEKLKPMCVDTGMSWEERRARQKQEIEALKEALAILEDFK